MLLKMGNNDGNNDEVTVEDEQKQKQLAVGGYRNP